MAIKLLSRIAISYATLWQTLSRTDLENKPSRRRSCQGRYGCQSCDRLPAMQLKPTLRLLLFALAGLPLTGADIKPESVGLSAERLARIHDTMQRHIDAHDISGAVTLVARKGQIAWVHSQGGMDIEAKKPMQKDAIFRVFSMSKPVCGVAILMLLEEGKVRL